MTLDWPIRFERQVLAKPWGGGEQLRDFGVRVPTEPPTGEVWLVSDVPGRSSRITEGAGAGGTLQELLAQNRDAVLGPSEGPFPLLIKLLEIRGRLSLQVHPDAAAAQRNGDGPSGKFEAWSVLAATPGAWVTLGFDCDLSREEAKRLIETNSLRPRLNTFAPAPGESFAIPTGVVHAAGGGLLVLEVQETCDVTYRLYDWGAVGLDGKPRELHVEKGLAAATLTKRQRPAPLATRREPGVEVRAVVSQDMGPFVYEIARLAPGVAWKPGPPPWIAVGIDGEVEVGGSKLTPGDAILVPACAENARVSALRQSTCAVASPRLA
ncbi:MAG TPA: type I phosphomannose isomerase catalytic subunit [Planctomycetota bacterium]|nr:type I phosphomannose isomerase catalytic subunit [Planctomycetota bacterium]